MTSAARGSANELILVEVAGEFVRVTTYEHGPDNDPSSTVDLNHRATLALVAGLTSALYGHRPG